MRRLGAAVVAMLTLTALTALTLAGPASAQSTFQWGAVELELPAVHVGDTLWPRVVVSPVPDTKVFTWTIAFSDGTPSRVVEAPSYLVTEADWGAEISFDVSVTKAGMTPETYSSATYDVLAGTPDIDENVPGASSGVAEVGRAIGIEPRITMIDTYTRHTLGSRGTLSYQWQVGEGAVWRPLAGETGFALVPGPALIGQRVRRVTTFTSATATWQSTSTHPARWDVVPGRVRATFAPVGEVRLGEVVEVAAVWEDHFPRDQAVTYSWRADGVEFAAGTPFQRRLSGTATELRGRELTVDVRVVRSGYEPFTTTVAFGTIRGLARTGGSVALSRTPQVGKAISAVPTFAEPATSYDVEWRVSGKVVARTASFTPRPVDTGKKIVARVVARHGAYEPMTADSASVTIQAAPIRASVPSTVRSGRTLSVTVSGLVPGRRITLSFAGQRVTRSVGSTGRLTLQVKAPQVRRSTRHWATFSGASIPRVKVLVKK
ncbi:hypothetical protein [Nocardioides sp. J54]|uniref:hypothetical protein n=1 Tax=Nocardioides sp. J54 TaxID=935866 RepID=UPI0018DC8DEB|nr:hypothetical protein [Nocardioides sp. J54]